MSEVDDVPEKLRSGAKEVLSLVDAGDTATAIARCDALAASAHQDHIWHILSLKAFVYQMGRDKENALHWLGEAIRLNQSASSLRYKRALLLIDTNRFDDAIVDCLVGETEESQKNSIYFLNSFRIMRAFCLLRKGMRKEALDAVESVPSNYAEWLHGTNVTREAILSQAS